MAYPYTYASETNGDLLGDLVDQTNMMLMAALTNTGTTLTVDTTKVDGNIPLPVPSYLKIENEIVKATAVVDNTHLTIVRGQLGTAAVAHTPTANAPMYAFVVVTSQHFITMRNQALLAQKYHGLVGLDADKPASPAIGEVYVATDTKKVYVCVDTGWKFLGGITTHADTIAFGETDDHSSLYFTQTSATTWHNAKTGGHLQDGSSHDHTKGRGAGRIRTTAPGTYNTGDAYYNQTTKELNIALNATTWGKVTGAPVGAIIMFTDLTAYGNTCPPGWTRYTALDGRYIKGAAAGVTNLGIGGAATHDHSYDNTAIPQHSHSIAKMSKGSGGASPSVHRHHFDYTVNFNSSGAFAMDAGNNGDTSYKTDAAGDHSHSNDGYPATTTNGAISGAGPTGGTAATASSAKTDPQPSTPPYREVVFCYKAS